MDYKVEIMVEKRIVFSDIYRGYSHPSQVVKFAIKSIAGKADYASVYIMNRLGEMWFYALEKVGSRYTAHPMGHAIGGRKEVMLSFSGNKTIAELL